MILNSPLKKRITFFQGEYQQKSTNSHRSKTSWSEAEETRTRLFNQKTRCCLLSYFRKMFLESRLDTVFLQTGFSDKQGSCLLTREVTLMGTFAAFLWTLEKF